MRAPNEERRRGVTALRGVAPDLWVAEQPLRFGGLEVGTRMTVVRLRDGGLFLHSPVALGDRLQGELAAIGAPLAAVAPNRFHHLFVGEYRAAFPDVRLFVAPGLETKRKDLAGATVLGDEPPREWSGEIDQLVFRGVPISNEVVFLHRRSRTLLLADLAFNLGPEAPAATRLVFRALGAYDRFGPTRLERLLVRDRAAARRSLELLLQWDFDRVVVAHGRILESGGREALRRGYAWLLDG